MREHIVDSNHSNVLNEKKFTRAAHLKIHERTHSLEQPLQCTQCEKKFTQAGNLKKQGTTHTNEKPTPLWRRI